MRHFAAPVLLLTAFTLVGCRQPPVRQRGPVNQAPASSGPLAPTPDPSFGGGSEGGPLLPPAMTSSNRTSPFRRVSAKRLLPTPDDGMPTSTSGPSLW